MTATHTPLGTTRIPSKSDRINPMDETEAFIEAMCKLQEALKILDPIAANWKNSHTEEAQDIMVAIQQIISCDNGEAGMDPMISKLVERYAPRD